ncbi:DUF2059 domain-containing protein [Brevundimonas sp.]|uniref:DUF2059 domain-containing protein n=1 Tax=Brevundimonas sp. TaxID=1871086 RepID=UPI00121E7745|nr:DUF2059 domain-containing protein [Brevundimonas sp.]TAJ56095.1 MAG: DUF2059 domain-containing protein [Brevundimonas sp.]
MRIVILLLAAVWLGLAAPAAAQDAAGDARRLALAEQYLEVTQGETLEKSINAYFDEAFAKSEMPDDQRDWLTRNMSVAFEQAMQATFADLTDDVAELFSEEELEAMIAFYDTPLGRSITEKNFEFGVRLETVMTPHLTEVFTQLGEKFCVRFECEAGEEAASKFGL